MTKTKLTYVIQAVVLVAILIWALIPGSKKHYDASELICFSGIYTQGEGVVCDSSMDYGYAMKTPDMKLSYGTYKVTVEYSTNSDQNIIKVGLPDVINGIEDAGGRYVFDNVVMYSYENEADAEILVKSGSSNYLVMIFFTGNGDLTVRSIDIVKTSAGTLRLFIIMLAIFAIIDVLVYLYNERKSGRLQTDTVLRGLVLTGIVVFSSLPLFVNYMVEGHDLLFHLLRIEGIKEGLMMGQFPVRIQPNWLSGNGYATSVFYGDLLLYFPVLLRLCGFTIREAYNIYVLAVNIATTLISYYCFDKMFGRKKAALVGSALYTLSLYRLTDIYVRSSVGEYSAMIFLPLLAYSMWLVFGTDHKSAEYKKAWIPGVIAFSGIINTHLLTCEIVAGFIILLCLIYIKKVFRIETFTVLVKIVVITTLLNLWFIVPLLDYMRKGGFIVTDSEPIITSVQIHGAFLTQLLIPFSSAGGLSVTYLNGMAGEIPVTMGLSLILVFALAVVCLFMGRVNDKKDRSIIWVGLIFSGISLYASTYLFPWDAIGRIATIAKKMTLLIQFPFRLLGVAMLMLSIVAVLLLKLLKDSKYYKTIVITLVVIAGLQGGHFISDVMNSASPLFINYDSLIDSNNIIGAEYLPSDSAPQQFLSQYELVPDGLTYTCNERIKNTVDCTVTNTTGDVLNLGLSMVYYRGYQAVDAATGEKLLTYGRDGLVTVCIPPNYSGRIIVKFAQAWYWQVATLISLATLVALVLVECIGVTFVKKNKNSKESSND